MAPSHDVSGSQVASDAFCTRPHAGHRLTDVRPIRAALVERHGHMREHCVKQGWLGLFPCASYCASMLVRVDLWAVSGWSQRGLVCVCVCVW